MPSSYIVKTPPSGDVITMDAAKAHLNIFHDEIDGAIQGFINAAVRRVERLTRHSLLRTVWYKYLDTWETITYLDKKPVKGVVSVEYWSNDAWQVLPATDYEVDTICQRVCFLECPTVDRKLNGIRIEFEAGETNGALINPDLLQAVSLFMAGMECNREDKERSRKMITAAENICELYLNKH